MSLLITPSWRVGLGFGLLTIVSIGAVRLNPIGFKPGYFNGALFFPGKFNSRIGARFWVSFFISTSFYSCLEVGAPSELLSSILIVKLALSFYAAFLLGFADL